ncbi:glycosyltransferase family 4 protein [Flavobacterium sp.]|uniref:glycosyltransferase family 4 protein n=1 Tax=Flavobacterium sp. TaxID=239 RepID=UPI003B9AFBEF
MDLIFATNARFTKTPDGKIYGYHTALNRKTFEHYLLKFDNVKIIARVERHKDEVLDDSIRVDSDRISILEVPYFIGPLQYLKKAKAVRSAIRSFISNDDALICRVPGTLGRIAAYEAMKIKRKYGVEVAADPYDVFAPGSFKHPLRRFLRIIGTYQLRRVVKNASAAIYVTKYQLQKRYPVSSGIFQTYASNVILKSEFLAHAPKSFTRKTIYDLISVGSLDQLYKAPDVLIQAVEIINNKGLDFKVRLTFLGSGKYRNSLISAKNSGSSSDLIDFPGAVKPFSKVVEYLDNADLFLLVSRTEGLPRALVEGMGRGLPAIGTLIGGIPELLEERVLVPINNPTEVANKVISILQSPDLYNKLAERNLEFSKDFVWDKLNERRFRFYDEVINFKSN